MDMITLKINGISVTVPKGSTVLDAARVAGIEIPTLCFMKEKNEIGACRICVVEVNEGRGFRMVTACVFPASAIVKTDYIAPGHKLPSFEIDAEKCVKCGVCMGNCKFKAISKV